MFSWFLHPRYLVVTYVPAFVIYTYCFSPHDFFKKNIKKAQRHLCIFMRQATKMSSNAMAWYIASAALGLCKADFSRCLAECVNYFAGATSNDAMICQKAGGMSGDCYPAYGCAKGMITCVDQAWTGALPDLTDVRTACSGLSDLTAENPWTCGTSEEARPPCVHDTPNNNIGKWLLADADLGCGWGSYYGKATPNYSGSGTPYTEYFYNVANEQQCCEHAMSFQSSSSTQGGPALFFQLMEDGRCRVDREMIIYSQLDGSSGMSVKYQQRCGTGRLFYRHAAGASAAANQYTGGTRCVVEGKFERLDLQRGRHLPIGEIYSMGALAPGRCPGEPTGQNDERTCKMNLVYNTIADPEDCCEECRHMNWLPEMGGAVEMVNGLQINPCVAWQIVEGRCRINRKAYYDLYNPGQSIQEAVEDQGHGPPGNSGWLVRGRSCGTSLEACGHWSYVYYRNIDSNGAPELPVTTATVTTTPTLSNSISGELLVKWSWVSLLFLFCQMWGLSPPAFLLPKAAHTYERWTARMAKRWIIAPAG